MTYCTQCGAEQQAGDAFCRSCGAARTTDDTQVGWAPTSGATTQVGWTPPAAQRAPASLSPATSPPTAARRGSVVPIVIGLVAVLLLGVGGAAGWVRWRPGDQPQQRSAAAAPVPVVAATTPAPVGEATSPPVAGAATQAPDVVSPPGESSSDASSDRPTVATDDVSIRTELLGLRDGDLASTPRDSTWVAQLSSKYVGVTDASLQAVPFTVQDIYDEHIRLRGNSDYGDQVRLFLPGDFGKRGRSAKEIWITIVDLEAASKADVDSWCSQHFSQTGMALANVCLPRQFTPPHD